MREERRGLKGSWEWLAFAAQLPSNPQPLAGVSASQLIYGGRCILTGAWLQNNGTAAGGANLIDGQDATGTLIAVVPLAAQASTAIDLPGQGVLCELGVYLQVTTAVIRGSVYVIPLWHYRDTPPGE